MTDMRFSRLGLISTRPYYWMASPGGYEHTLGVIRLLYWGLQVPDARLGVNPRGIGLIIRSIQAAREVRATPEEERLLDHVGADAEDAVFWRQDAGRYNVDFLWGLLRRSLDVGEWLWLSAQEAELWARAIDEALREYEEELRTSDPLKLARLVSRHEFMLFGPFDLDIFANHMLRPRQGGALAQHANYAPVLAEIEQVSSRIGVTSPIKAYWSWQFLNFDLTRIGGATVLYNTPILALWNTWPASQRWAPPRPATPSGAAPVTAEVAAEYLESLLWKQVETIFAYLTIDCGLPSGATIISTGRNTGAPVYYFAAPTDPPSDPERYLDAQGARIRPLVRTCLATDDPLSDEIAWGVLEGRMVALRCEIAQEQFRPWVLLLPLGDDGGSKRDRDSALDADLFRIVVSLTAIELAIDMQAANVESEMQSISASIGTWPQVLERGNEMTERAIALVPIVGQADRAELSQSVKYLHVPLRRMTARFEQAKSRLARLQRSYRASKDATDDTLRKRTLRGLSTQGVRSLHDALLDAYPYHFLQDPLANLHGRVETALGLATQVTTSVGIVLTEAEQTTRERLERWARGLAVVISLLALLIGLPTFVPGATLRADTYPDWLTGIASLSFVENVLRGLAGLITLSAAISLVVVLIVLVLRIFPRQKYDVERFALLLEEARRTATSGVDEATNQAKLEALDTKASQLLARIWKQGEQQTSKGSLVVRRRPWRYHHAADLSRDIQLVGDIISLSIHLAEEVPLPRTLCILRYKLITWFPEIQELVSAANFQESLQHIAFFDTAIVALHQWLSEDANRYRIDQLDVEAFAAVLKAHDVTTVSSKRDSTKWSGYLDDEQQHALQGGYYLNLGEYDKAIDELRQAIHANPKSAEYYNYLGTAYDGLDRYAEAVKAYQHAIRLDDQDPYVHNNLGDTYVSQGNLEGARREFLRRVQLKPDDALAARTSLGVILIHQGKSEEGRQQLQAALRVYLQLAPTQGVMSSDAYFMNRALVLAGLGDPDAIGVWQEAVNRRQIPAEELADWKRYIDLLKTAPQPPASIASIAELLEVAGTTRSAR